MLSKNNTSAMTSYQ